MNDKILVVDDSKVDQLIISDILKCYDTIIANDGVEALEILENEEDIDIVILDLKMPRMGGFEVLEHLKEEITHGDLSILILTNYEEIESEIKGLEYGAVDYIRKPLNSKSLLKRIQVHLNLIHVRKEVKMYNHLLEEKVIERTAQLELTRDITVNALIGLLEVRDIESSNHTRRTQWMMKALAVHLSTKNGFNNVLTQNYIQALFKTAPLHDIGKVGIPDKILLKPGKLTVDEFELMKEHVKYGVDALVSEFVDKEMDSFIHTAIKLIGAHHEKYDGTGYPNGTKGKLIPLEGRLMAIIDVYDALTSKRVYKEAFPHDSAIDVLTQERGKHFDPEIVDAFIEIKDEIKMIAIKYHANTKGGIFEE